MFPLHYFVICLFIPTTSGYSVEPSSERKCNISEEYSALQPCTNISSQLNELFMEYNDKKIREDVMNNMTELCTNVTTCYNSTQCSTSQNYKEFYEAKCQNLEFQKADLYNCVFKFYEDIEHFNCTDQYYFLSDDLDQRKESYNSGKLCFLEIVEKKCSEEAKDYVPFNYNTLVETLTEKPEGDTCAEPFHEFHYQQCQAAISKAKTQIVMAFGRDKPSIFDERWASVCGYCQEAQECAQNCCKFNDYDRESVNNFCSPPLKINTENLEKCLKKLEEENPPSEIPPFLNTTIWNDSCALYDSLNGTKNNWKEELNKFCEKTIIKEQDEHKMDMSLMGCNSTEC
ncbi:hypothetical protein B9Z55_020641 [Caenorhabditis nigoni]|uniref:T20D4.11-like domain-containing protein n=1 Tax=Caenorhabditis nigoni TaxID=1611254 RepID=A0A2G5TNH1_9PELO|nr:hypothetical protein B9Z55_020641 [Caenorhabditis nigoni]